MSLFNYYWNPSHPSAFMPFTALCIFLLLLIILLVQFNPTNLPFKSESVRCSRCHIGKRVGKPFPRFYFPISLCQCVLRSVVECRSHIFTVLIPCRMTPKQVVIQFQIVVVSDTWFAILYSPYVPNEMFQLTVIMSLSGHFLAPVLNICLHQLTFRYHIYRFFNMISRARISIDSGFLLRCYNLQITLPSRLALLSFHQKNSLVLPFGLGIILCFFENFNDSLCPTSPCDFILSCNEEFDVVSRSVL